MALKSGEGTGASYQLLHCLGSGAVPQQRLGFADGDPQDPIQLGE